MDEARDRRLAAKRAHYERNKSQILRKQKEKYATIDGAAKRARVNRYRLANLETVRAKKAAYRIANKEQIQAKKRRDYLANREEVLAKHKSDPAIPIYMKAYRAKNKEKLAAQIKAWRERNPEKHKTMRQAWRDEHKAERVHAEGRRRARKKNNGGSHTYEEWIARCEAFKWRCVYCQAEGEMTRDHDMPVSRGGRDSINNIVPACRTCNSSKGTRTGAEFLSRFLRAA